MLDYLNDFWDFFFYPFLHFDVENELFVLIYTVLVALVVFSFVRKVLQCFLSF